MQTILDTMKGRRSIRRFKEQAVADDELAKLFEAVQCAPSWANTQCWEIVVIQDAALQETLSGLLSKKNPATLAVAKAPVVFAICADRTKAGYYSGKQITKFADWFMFDLGLASENLCLAACELGLGTVIVGAFDHDRTGELLGLPPGFEAVALIPIGYPDHDPSPPKRRPVSEFIHQGRFARK